MCYIVAKKNYEIGSLAFKTDYGEDLSKLVTYLTEKTLDKNIEILTVSNMEGYGEYAPYHEILTKEEFIKKVLGL